MTTGFQPTEIEVILLGAVAKNGVIGTANKLPWNCPEDLEWFKNVTSEPDTVMLMGRKTWDSLPIGKKSGEKLAGRKKIVMSHRAEQVIGKDVRFINQYDSGITNDLRALGFHKVFVIGGKQIYDTMSAHATGALLTQINAEPYGDVSYNWEIHKIYLERDLSVEPIRLSKDAKVFTYKRKNDISGWNPNSNDSPDW